MLKFSLTQFTLVRSRAAPTHAAARVCAAPLQNSRALWHTRAHTSAAVRSTVVFFALHMPAVLCALCARCAVRRPPRGLEYITRTNYR